MKYSYGLILFVLCILLSSCTIVGDKGSYYDEDRFIVYEGDSYSFISCIGDFSDMTIREFSGTETIFTYDTRTELTIDVEYEMFKGRFKVVLINPENEIIELNGEQTFSLEGGIYRIKIVGDHASGYVSIDMK